MKTKQDQREESASCHSTAHNLITNICVTDTLSTRDDGDNIAISDVGRSTNTYEMKKKVGSSFIKLQDTMHKIRARQVTQPNNSLAIVIPVSHFFLGHSR